MESVYENLKNHFRRKLSCFRLELLGFDLLKGVAVVLFTFLLLFVTGHRSSCAFYFFYSSMPDFFLFSDFYPILNMFFI